MSSPSSRSTPSAKLRGNPDAQLWLERSRERVQARRARAREAEKVIASAVRRFIAGWVSINECERCRDNAIEALNRQIRLLQTQANDELRGYRAEQAAAAASIREQGQSDEEVAELLEITPKEVRRLIIESRVVAAAASSALESANAEPARETYRSDRDVSPIRSDLADVEQEPGRPTSS